MSIDQKKPEVGPGQTHEKGANNLTSSAEEERRRLNELLQQDIKELQLTDEYGRPINTEDSERPSRFLGVFD